MFNVINKNLNHQTSSMSVHFLTGTILSVVFETSDVWKIQSPKFFVCIENALNIEVEGIQGAGPQNLIWGG
jgi:hypothetical protein